MKNLLAIAVLFLSFLASPAQSENIMKSDMLAAFPDEILTAIIWMNVERKIPYEDIRFDPPHAENYSENIRNQMFHPEGGNIEYKTSDYNELPYIFTSKNSMKGMETDETELLAILTNIDAETCNQINKELDFPRQRLFSAFFERLKDDEAEYDYIPLLTETPNLEYIGYEKEETLITALDISTKRGCYEIPGKQYYYVYTLIQR